MTEYKSRMNDPKLARERVEAVRTAKEQGCPEDEAFEYIREVHDTDFEGHLLEATIERLYNE